MDFVLQFEKVIVTALLDLSIFLFYFILYASMSSLLAIFLVVNSTRGHHYLFSYPPNPKRPSSSQRGGSSGVEEVFYGSSMTSRLNANDQRSTQMNNNSKDAFAGRDTIFNIDVSFLADAMAPKLPLCDRKFQLCIDDLTFVGHPVSLSSLQTESSCKEQDEGVQDLSNTSSQSTSTPNSSPSTNINNHEQNDDQSVSSSSSNNNNHNNNESSAMNSISDNNESDGDSSDDATDNHDDDSVSDTSPGSIHMTLFHVVFVMSPPDLELNSQVETLYRHVILKYSSALRYEQLRCGYVQEEIEKVLILKEEAYNKGTR
jgi:hypothetical protein